MKIKKDDYILIKNDSIDNNLYGLLLMLLGNLMNLFQILLILIFF